MEIKGDEKEQENTEVDVKTYYDPKEHESAKISDSEKEEIIIEREQLVDNGLAWLTVLGCFIGHFVIGGFERNEGIYFLQFRERFDKPAKLTALPGTFVSSLRHFLGPVAAAMCQICQHGIRTTTLIGAITLTVSCVCTAYTPNFPFLFFSRSVLEGVGNGLLYAPSLICLNMHFDKRQSLAAGLGSSGVGVGTLCLVPLTQYLFDHYGFRMTFLILAGIAATSLLVPLLSEPFIFSSGAPQIWRESQLEVAIMSSHSLDFGTNPSLMSINHQSRLSRALNDCPIRSQNRDCASKVVLFSEEELNTRGRSSKVFPELETPSPAASNEPDQSHDLTEAKAGFPRSWFRCCCRSKNENGRANKIRMDTFFHFELLQDPSFALFCFSLALFSASLKAIFIFIPALVKSKGNSESDAALVLSMTGIFDTGGRVASGIIFDTSLLRPWRPVIYTCLIFDVAACIFSLPSVSSLWSYYVICSTFGFFSGAYVAQKSVVVVDVVGTENMANSFGLLIFFQAIGNTVGPVLLGTFWDVYETFDGGFYMAGGSAVLSALLMTVSNICLHMKKQEEMKEERGSIVNGNK